MPSVISVNRDDVAGHFRGGFEDRGPGGRFDGPGFPGELPESTTPDDEDSTPSPSQSESPSSNS
jgi:hypothetical protein